MWSGFAFEKRSARHESKSLWVSVDLPDTVFPSSKSKPVSAKGIFIMRPGSYGHVFGVKPCDLSISLNIGPHWIPLYGKKPKFLDV